MTLYSKDNITKAVSSMKRSGKMSRSFLLTGEKGAGKKTAALYIAKTLMCENCVRGVPCGTCRHCRRADEGTHPDIITPERSGVMKLYTADTIKEMYADAYTMPNDCDAKVYILADCENIQERTQNIMLKLIEEPPDHAYFIFTAGSRSVFLPTILSRVVSFGVPECTEEECAKALAENGGYSSGQIQDAVGAFHGNIGRCLEYLSGGEAADDVRLCRAVAESIVSGDEYAVNKALYDIGTDREKAARIIEMTDRVIRDVLVIRIQGKDCGLIGCCGNAAEQLSGRLSFRKADSMHEALVRTLEYLSHNVNVPAAMSLLAGKLV